MGTGSGRPNSTAERCVKCSHAVRHEQHLALGRQVERLWAEGKTLRQIADDLGWGPTSDSSVLVTQFRNLGFDLPYRYDERRRRASVTARWVA
jgi:UTP:GlnB (protein PII) uridylyltransferase